VSNHHRKSTARQKYGKHEEYLKYKEAIWEVDHPDEAMPPIHDFLPAGKVASFFRFAPN
jgi:E3 SUMO-protein ligase NSE2